MSFETSLLDFIVTAVISAYIKKNLSNSEFCVAILILNTEEKSNSFDMLCLIISTKVKMQLKHKNRRAMYGEGIVTDQT